MERVGNYDETQTILGLYGTMPPPSGPSATGRILPTYGSHHTE
jgi:hypothetical protein